MLNAETILIAFTSLIVTGIIVWLVVRTAMLGKHVVLTEKLHLAEGSYQQLQQTNNTLLADKNELIRQTTRTESELHFITEQYNSSKRYQKENEILHQQLAMFKAKFQSAEERLAVQKEEMEISNNNLRNEFRHLTQTIVEETSQRLIALNEEKINAILTSFKLQLGEFRQKVDEKLDKES